MYIYLHLPYLHFLNGVNFLEYLVCFHWVSSGAEGRRRNILVDYFVFAERGREPRSDAESGMAASRPVSQVRD